MSLTLSRIAKAASLLMLVAACGANDAGTGKGGRGGQGDPSDGTGGDGSGGSGGDDWDDDFPDSGSGIDPDASCAKTSMESNALPTMVMFQLDTSGSMNCFPTESEAQCDANPKAGSRWEILREALKDAFPSIPSGTSVGLMHYPGPGFLPPAICDPSRMLVGVAPLDTAQQAKLNTALDQITPKQGTPTHDAMAAALTELRKLPPGNKYIILATDGAAGFCIGCNAFCFDQKADNDLMIKSVGEVWQKENIGTFVIGVPGSEAFRNELSRMAQAGGTAKPGCGANDCHFDMTTSPGNFGDAIADVLGEISEQLLGCSYSIPSQDEGSFDPGKVNVQFTDDGGTTTDLPRDPQKQDGWDYSADGKQIELHGQACEKAKASQKGRIDIVFGCPTIVK